MTVEFRNGILLQENRFGRFKYCSYICIIMKIGKNDIIKMNKAVSRNIELEAGRVNYNRVHKSVKAYSRKGKGKFNINLAY